MARKPKWICGALAVDRARRGAKLYEQGWKGNKAAMFPVRKDRLASISRLDPQAKYAYCVDRKASEKATSLADYPYRKVKGEWHAAKRRMKDYFHFPSGEEKKLRLVMREMPIATLEKIASKKGPDPRWGKLDERSWKANRAAAATELARRKRRGR